MICWQGLETGKVVFYNINTARGIWNKAAATKGSNGWWFNASGLVSDAANGVASIELDKAQKALILSVSEESAAGVSVGANVGFAHVDNGKDYDDYIRFNVNFAVTDPGTIIRDINIPDGDYNYDQITSHLHLVKMQLVHATVYLLQTLIDAIPTRSIKIS